jgi:hypothetical protein
MMVSGTQHILATEGNSLYPAVPSLGHSGISKGWPIAIPRNVIGSALAAEPKPNAAVDTKIKAENQLFRLAAVVIS